MGKGNYKPGQGFQIGAGITNRYRTAPIIHLSVALRVSYRITLGQLYMFC